MASYLATYSRRNTWFVFSGTCARRFSKTAPAFKKRRNVQTKVDDIFADNYITGSDLFSSISLSNTSARVSAQASVPSFIKRTDNLKSKPKVANELFDEQYRYATDRLRPESRVKHPALRQNMLRRLLHYQSNEEQLDRILELLVLWRNTGRRVDMDTTLEFIDRCLVSKPSLLVKVFVDRPRYGMNIPSLPDARRILRSLVFKRSIAGKETRSRSMLAEDRKEALHDALLFAALLPVHGLPSATTDETCCALLAQACARSLVYRQPDAGLNGKDKFTEFSAESMRRLLAIASELWCLLRRDVENFTRQSSDFRGSSKTMISRRECGYTQSSAVESLWVTHALRDVVRALHITNSSEVAAGLSNLLSQRVFHE